VSDAGRPSLLASLAAVAEALGSDPATVAESLIEDLDGGLSEVRRALDRGDARASLRAAHAARNGALLIGDTRLLRLLGELEGALRAQDLAAAGAKLEELRSGWAQVRRVLRRANRSR